uniref:Zgc:101664 n=1 Tax=Amphilophus citrinellus TaxID=61819 RepID=A0A3Q0R3A5_AMPCI
MLFLTQNVFTSCSVGLGSLLETTQKLLEPFPCRTPPVFTPWFPTASGDCPLPLRPGRPHDGPSSQSLSKQFHHTVSIHGLHLRQRAKWVIRELNCGTAGNIEEVGGIRSVRSSRLPTCNANIQRERAEIWVFCDVLHSEQVGRFLKDELKLSGRISLTVHRLGNIFSM